MVEIISVRFKEGGKHYYFNPNGAQFQPGEGVIVETTRGTEFGECVQGNTPIDEMELTAPLRPVLRRATPEDELTREKNKEKEAKALEICQQKILEHGLEMKLVDAEWSFEGNKVLFFFTAESRVDFRALVKDLASAIHARIELRQIGVRDEAKMLGGLGICGRPFCCSQFLDEFQPVSIKMAKTQNLSLNPTKISGTCGRLMCCLKYEQHAYEEAAKNMPKNESFVDTPDGVGNISAVDLLREEVTVRLDNAPESPKRYKRCEIRVLRNGKGSREGIEIPGERPARFVPESAAADEPRPPRRLSSVGRVSAVPVEPDEEEPVQEEKRDRSRRRRRRGRGDKPKAAPAAPEKAAKSPEKPVKAAEKKAEAKPRRQERQAKAVKAEKVEKLTVRQTTDTTAEKKAAADRAADRAARQSAPAAGQEGKPSEGRARRHRPRRRPRGKKEE